MRTLIFSSLFVAALVCTVGCSDPLTAPANAGGNGSETAGPIDKSGAQIAAIYIKYDGIDGEVNEFEEAMDIYSGNGTETAALLLPAVQKVREVSASLVEDAGRDGSVDANKAEKALRKMIQKFSPAGRAYSMEDLIVTSLRQSGREKSYDDYCYKHNDLGKIELYLYHIFNGMQVKMSAAGIDDRTINAAMTSLQGQIANISSERPQ